MPRAPPQNLSRSFNTRCTGLFKKAAELHHIDDRVRISIIVEKPGITPLVFTTDERGHNWPPFVDDYVKRQSPFIKRPTHYQSVVEGISRGHVQIVYTSSSSPPSPHVHGNTSDGKAQDTVVQQVQDAPPNDQQLGDAWSLPTTPPRPIPSRKSTSSPLPKNIILPSKRGRGLE